MTAWAVADDGREWETPSVTEAIEELASRKLEGRIDIEDDFTERHPYYRRKGRALFPLFPIEQEYWDALEEEEDAISDAVES